MPYTTAAQWIPVLDDMEARVALCRKIIKAVDYAKAVAKYLDEEGPAYETTLTPTQVNVLRQAFLAQMQAVKTELDAALA